MIFSIETLNIVADDLSFSIFAHSSAAIESLHHTLISRRQMQQFIVSPLNDESSVESKASWVKDRAVSDGRSFSPHDSLDIIQLIPIRFPGDFNGEVLAAAS